jgi:glycosyltransferase involved in cell wall biosynthesis
MADVLLNVLDALVAVLATDAVAIADGDGRLDDAAAHLGTNGTVRLDRVDRPQAVARDARLVVARLGDTTPWADVAHAVTLFVGTDAIALDSREHADLGRLLDEYSDALVVALQEQIALQADQIVALRAQLAERPEVPAVGTALALAPGAATEDAPVPVVPLPDEPLPVRLETSAERRFAGFFAPDTLLAALGWPDAQELDLGRALPIDRRPPGDAEALRVVIACGSASGLLRTSWSILHRATQATAVDIELPPGADDVVRRAAHAIATVGPDIRVLPYGTPTPGAIRLTAGQFVLPGWPQEAPHPRRLAFVLAGVAPGGSGGSHSVLQEALGLRALDIDVRVFVPTAAIERVRALYPEAATILTAYASTAALADAASGLDALIATEYTTVPPVVAAARRSGALPAYYVQDYEPLFAADESGRADAAVLSYRADPELRLFAKTHWVRNVVTALHGVPVELVTPSIDTSVFHPAGRRPAGSDAVVRVAAMVRPRTPRRRPLATVRLLEALRAELGAEVEIVTFGCDDAELLALTATGDAAWEHLGLTTRGETADLLRRSDVFVDLSVYQAFGRTGCEAMACGAVPVLPVHGGTAQYARDGVNALLVDGGDADRTLAETLALVRDGPRLRLLAEAGVRTTAHFTIEAAARSWADALGAAIASRPSDRG